MDQQYQVSSSGRLNARIRELYQEAAANGQADAFDQAIRFLHLRLATDPLSFGEATFNYHHLGLVNFTVVAPPLSIEYCVDEARRIVYLRRINLL